MYFYHALSAEIMNEIDNQNPSYTPHTESSLTQLPSRQGKFIALAFFLFFFYPL